MDQLRALAAVIDQGTFDAAASALHVTPSAISQRIKSLEQQLGKVLLKRGKPALATSAGQILLRLARQFDLLEREAARELGLLSTAQGRSLPLVVNADSLATWALPALAGLSELDLEILVDDQEHTAAWLREGAAVAAVTSEATAVAGCRVSRLGILRYRPAAHPDFVQRWFPSGVDAQSLSAAPLLVFNRKDQLQNTFLERFLSPADPRPPLRFIPSSAEFVRAAELGLGWGMVPEPQLSPALDQGSLVLLEPQGYVDVRLYWQQWAINSSVLDQLAAALREAAAAVLR